MVLSVLIGSVIGYIARKVLRYAQEKRLIDHESFLSFGVALTLFTLGVVGILGSDDLLCCFAVGNSFTWDDWFRVETEDHSFQDVIDQLLNSAIFLYIGAIMPWHEFGNFWGITPWRLVVLGLLVILVRRMPWVLLLVNFLMMMTFSPLTAVPLHPCSPDLERRCLCRLLWPHGSRRHLLYPSCYREDPRR